MVEQRLENGRPEPLPAVRLRGHHLLCVLTFIGKGYSPAFVEGMAAVVDRLSAGSAIRIVSGPDDICAAHLGDTADPHCRLERASARDMAALKDISSLWSTALEPDVEFHPPGGWVDQMRAAFTEGTIRSACDGCRWNALCTALASDGYQGARLHSPSSVLTGGGAGSDVDTRSNDR